MIRHFIPNYSAEASPRHPPWSNLEQNTRRILYIEPNPTTPYRCIPRRISLVPILPQREEKLNASMARRTRLLLLKHRRAAAPGGVIITGRARMHSSRAINAPIDCRLRATRIDRLPGARIHHCLARLSTLGIILSPGARAFSVIGCTASSAWLIAVVAFFAGGLSRFFCSPGHLRITDQTF